jgi:hypothetical protein
MKWLRVLCLLAVAAAARADELHLRDGTVIVGAYIGGTQKAIYFQRTPGGTDIFPLFMVESVSFNSVPRFAPGASSPPSPPKRTLPVRFTAALAAQVKWAFALFFPPPPAAQLTHPAD